MGKQKSLAEAFATETNLSVPDASATVIKNKHLPRINTELHGNKNKQSHGIKTHHLIWVDECLQSPWVACFVIL
jgi:hypothetical protein